MDSAKKDDLGLCPGGLIAQAQRVPDEIGDVLELGHLIVVREDNSVPLLLELRNLLHEVETKVYTAADHRLISPDQT